MTDFSRNLVTLRTQKGLTQEELAKRAEVSQGAIWQYENGVSTPKIAVAINIAKALGTTCEALMSGKVDAANEQT